MEYNVIQVKPFCEVLLIQNTTYYVVMNVPNCKQGLQAVFYCLTLTLWKRGTVIIAFRHIQGSFSSIDVLDELSSFQILLTLRFGLGSTRVDWITVEQLCIDRDTDPGSRVLWEVLITEWQVYWKRWNETGNVKHTGCAPKLPDTDNPGKNWWKNSFSAAIWWKNWFLMRRTIVLTNMSHICASVLWHLNVEHI